MRSLFILFACLLFITAAVCQETTAILDFDNAPANIDCGAAWVEESFSLLASDHSMGGCSIENFNSQIFLAAGQLRVDLSGRTVSQVEVDIEDFCGDACTSAFLTQNGNTLLTRSNQLVNEPETLTFNGAELANATDLRIQSFEGAVIQIRITYTDPVPAGPVLEIIPDPAAPAGNSESFLLCWTDLLGAQLQRSADLQTWENVAPDEITFVGFKASYSVTQAIAGSPAGTGRLFYRLLVDDTIPE